MAADAEEGRTYEPPARLSPSSVGTFLQCPLRYRLSRLDQISEPKTPEQVRGSFVHEVLEHLFMAEPEKRTLATARQIAGELWAASWSAEVERDLRLSGKALREWRWHAWWCVEEYFTLEDPRLVAPSGLETKLEGKVAGVPFLGIIDRWSLDDDGRATVTDYKTGKAPLPRYASDKILQIMVYADMLTSNKDVDVNTVELIYLKTPGQKAQYQPTDSELGKMRTTVQSVWNDIHAACETGEFETRPGKLCNWCSYKNICPAFNSER